MRLRLATAFAASLFVSSTAVAHPLNLGYLDAEVRANGAVELRLTSAETAANLSAEQLLASVALTANDVACAPAHDLHGDTAGATAIFQCPQAPSVALVVAMPALEKAASGFQIVGRTLGSVDERVFNLDGEHTSAAIHWDGARSIQRFVMMGVRHIGAWPTEWYSAGRLHLPTGIDHILFLLALLLGGATLRRTIAMVTGFTLGHSVTLALAAFGWAHAPTRVVEAAIALSIIYVAVEDLVSTLPRHRWQVATFFGLVHGLAFASALTELHLERGDMAKALVGFNVGVELGQASLVVIISALFFAGDKLLRPSPKTRRRAVQVMALLILIPATYWFAQRALF